MSKLVYQRVAQSIAALIGVAGIVLIIFSVNWGYESFIGFDHAFPVLSLFFVLLGAVMMWTAYLAIRVYSIGAVKLLSALLAIFLLGTLTDYFQPMLEGAMESESTGLVAFIGGMPVIAAFICYRIVSAVLRKLTLSDELLK